MRALTREPYLTPQQQQNQCEGAKGYFRATKDGNPGAPRGPMNGNQQTAPAEAADGDRLPPSTNQVRDEAPRPLPSQGRCLSPRRLLNLVCAGRPSAARNPAPGQRLRALSAGLAVPPSPGQRRRVQRGLLAVFLRGYQASPSALETGRKRGEGCQSHGAWFAAAAHGGRRRSTSGGVVPWGKDRGSPGPPRLTSLCSLARRARTRGGARRRLSRAVGPGRYSGRGPPRLAGGRRRIFPSVSCKDPALFLRAEPWEKETTPSYLLGHHFLF